MIDVKFDTNGSLHILRNGVWKQQICCMNNDDTNCCDSCPHLGEPIKNQLTGFTKLHLCFDNEIQITIFFLRKET